jgi:hypothetical protein
VNAIIAAAIGDIAPVKAVLAEASTERIGSPPDDSAYGKVRRGRPAMTA